MRHTHIITHTDLDGVAAASVYIYLGRRASEEFKYSVLFAEPYNLDRVLEKSIPLKEDLRLAIMDIGVNPENFSNVLKIINELRKLGATIEWYDHHKWDASWKEELERIGVNLYIDPTTCAAGVVAKNAFKGLEEDDFLWELVDAACSADLWIWDHPLAPLLYRVAGYQHGSRGDAWRRMLIEEFSNCRLWWDSLYEVLENYIDHELNGYNEVLRDAFKTLIAGKITVACVVKGRGPPGSSLAASYILNRLETDLAIVVREDGGVSLRSRVIDVREIAVCMGGGGHPRASGARVKVPFYIRLLKVFSKKLYKTLILKRVLKEVERCVL